MGTLAPSGHPFRRHGDSYPQKVKERTKDTNISTICDLVTKC